MKQVIRSRLKSCLDILHANLGFVAGAALLDIGMYFYRSWALLLAAFILKIFFYSAVYGMIPEMLSGETIVLSQGKMKAAARAYWKMGALIAVLPFLLHFLCFMVFPEKMVSLIFIYWFGGFFFAVLGAGMFVFRKYPQPLRGPRRGPLFRPEDGAFLLLFGTLLAFGYGLQQILGTSVPALTIALFFLQAYLSLLTFTFFACCLVDAYPGISDRFQFEKEIYLINPLGGGGILIHWACHMLMRSFQPAWMTIISALTPKEYQLRLFNSVVWHEGYFASGKLVAISCSITNTSPEAYKLAKEFKRRGSTVVMGGLHVQAFPEEALEYCDSVVIGEGEGVWRQVIADYEGGCLLKKYYAQHDEGAYRMVHEVERGLDPSVIMENIETSRGCKYNCYFCAVKSMALSRYRKTVEEVIELVERLKKKHRKFTFLDNNLYSDPAYLKELFVRLKPLKVKWLAASTLELAENDELLTLAKEAGCELLFLGYEIVPGKGEPAQRGKLAMAPRYLDISRKIQKKGIAIRAHYILGFDEQGPGAFWDLFQFNFRLRPFLNGIFILTPLPGSAFFHDALAENRITTLNWRNYDVGTLVFKPKNIPAFMLKQPFFSIYIVVLFIFTTQYGWVLALLFLSMVVLG